MKSIMRSNHVYLLMLLLLITEQIVVSSDKSPTGIPASLQVDVNPINWYQRYKAKQKKLYTGNKPPLCKMGYYSGGRHVDFSLDLQGLTAFVVTGFGFRFLYSVSQFGTKLDTMKKSILYPGIAKSGLFWLPGVVAYGCVTSAKNHDFILHDRDELLRRLYEIQTNSNTLDR